jgi:hypothetical protein
MTKKIRFYLLFLIIILSSSEFVKAQTAVWSDDFESGVSTEWDLNTTVNGSFITDEGYLGTTIDWEGYDVWHSSTAVYGNWSFDIYSKYAWKRPHIYFVAEGILSEDDYHYPNRGYAIILEAEGPYDNSATMRFDLVFYPNNTKRPYPDLLKSYTPPFKLNGWQSIRVERDLEGMFHVYINDSLRIIYKHTKIENSVWFHVNGWGGWAIDNVVVNGTELETERSSAIVTVPTTISLISIAYLKKKQKRKVL